ncbi:MULTISPECIES: FecCD family ABC transporter permease [Gordonia]|uniref:FecCD family ABC transporter permease n=1 Tax=Gordonia TaxID=2053 RepID=UPI00301B1711
MTMERTTSPPLPRRGEVVLPVPRMRVRWYGVAVAGILTAILLVEIALELSVGEYPIPFGDAFRIMFGGGDDIERLIVDSRLARALVALGAGIALGSAGALTQTMAKNPLASPDVIGITMGASAAAVFVQVTAPNFAGVWSVPIAAMAGGVVTATVVVVLSAGGGVDTMRLVLVGVAVNALAAAVVSFLLVSIDLQDASSAVSWLAGSVTNSTWVEVSPLWAVIVVCAVVAAATSFDLRVMRLSDASARGLGAPVGVLTLVYWAVAVLLVSAAVAASGPIGFIALAGPQIARLLFRAPTPPLIGGALTGGVLLLGADLLSRLVFSDLAVGVITGVLGAPFLLVLLVIMHRKATV